LLACTPQATLQAVLVVHEVLHVAHETAATAVMAALVVVARVAAPIAHAFAAAAAAVTLLAAVVAVVAAGALMLGSPQRQRTYVHTPVPVRPAVAVPLSQATNRLPYGLRSHSSATVAVTEVAAAAPPPLLHSNRAFLHQSNPAALPALRQFMHTSYQTK
jgi:hypothetical protein